MTDWRDPHRLTVTDIWVLLTALIAGGGSVLVAIAGALWVVRWAVGG